MTLAGDVSAATYLKENVQPRVEETIFFNNCLLDGSTFQVVTDTPAGTYVETMIDEAVTTYAAAYTLGDPGPTADSSTSCIAKFNKDTWQVTAKTYDVYNMLMKGPGGNHCGLTEQDNRAIDKAARSLRDLATTSMLTDLVALVDSTSAFSDASLSRTTYPGLVSYEASTVGTLTEAHLQVMVEALRDVTYGPVRDEDMVFVMAANQWGHVSRFAGPAAYNATFATSSFALDGTGNIDSGITHRVKTYEGIDILVVPDFSTTDILLLDRSKVKVHYWSPVTIKPVSVFALEQAWIISIGTAIELSNPRNAGKLPGVTA